MGFEQRAGREIKTILQNLAQALRPRADRAGESLVGESPSPFRRSDSGPPPSPRSPSSAASVASRRESGSSKADEAEEAQRALEAARAEEAQRASQGASSRSDEGGKEESKGEPPADDVGRLTEEVERLWGEIHNPDATEEARLFVRDETKNVVLPMEVVVGAEPTDQSFNHIEIRGDGNCFYYAFLASYLYYATPNEDLEERIRKLLNLFDNDQYMSTLYYVKHGEDPRICKDKVWDPALLTTARNYIKTKLESYLSLGEGLRTMASLQDLLNDRITMLFLSYGLRNLSMSVETVGRDYGENNPKCHGNLNPDGDANFKAIADTLGTFSILLPNGVVLRNDTRGATDADYPVAWLQATEMQGGHYHSLFLLK